MNENPEGTPNPLNPAPGTGEEMAAGTGTLDFVETAQESEVMSGPETPVAPEVPEVQEVQEVATVQEPVASAEPVDVATFATATTTDNFNTLGVDNASTTNIPVEEVKEESFTMAESVPVATATPVTPVAPAEPTPMPEFVAKDSIVEPAGGNGKKKAFAIGAIAFLIIAIICGAAAVAVMLLNNNPGDRVTKAIEKLINGGAPNLVTVQGDISTFTDTNNASSISSLNIDFSGSFDTKTGINSVSAKINSEIAGSKISIGVDELRNGDNETFFKVRGLDTIMNNLVDQTATVDLNDCVSESYGTDNCATVYQPTATANPTLEMFSLYSGVFDVIDDQWILISGDFAENMEGMGVFDNSSTCLVDALETLPKYSKDIANKYEVNQFIAYSTDNLAISKKKNELYKISIDSEKLSEFINSLSNNGFINELNACAGNTATNTKVSPEMVESIFAQFPDVYVEIDNDYNFTRVYFKVSAADQNGDPMTVTADLSFSYPPKFEVETPEEYIDMSTLVNNLLTNMLYGATE